MFIDFNEAFDSLFHDKIWEVLATQEIQPEIITLLETMYKNCSAQIKLDRTGRIFKIDRGVRQGDPFTLNLFNAALKHIFRKMNWKGKGMKMKAQSTNLFAYSWLNNLHLSLIHI